MARPRRGAPETQGGGPGVGSGPTAEARKGLEEVGGGAAEGPASDRPNAEDRRGRICSAAVPCTPHTTTESTQIHPFRLAAALLGGLLSGGVGS